MNDETRTIEIDAATAEVLEARAKLRDMTVAELLAELARNDDALSPDTDTMRAGGEGPWSPEALAEEARRFAEFERTREGVPWDEVKTWMQSWGTPNELPPPKPRKL